MRPRKKHNLDKRMQAAASFRVERPEENKGRWRAMFGAPDDAPLHVELGCGKGTFVCESARRNPDICYIAFDKVPEVLVMAMEKGTRRCLRNISSPGSFRGSTSISATPGTKSVRPSGG